MQPAIYKRRNIQNVVTAESKGVNFIFCICLVLKIFVSLAIYRFKLEVKTSHRVPYQPKTKRHVMTKTTDYFSSIVSYCTSSFFCFSDVTFLHWVMDTRETQEAKQILLQPTLASSFKSEFGLYVQSYINYEPFVCTIHPHALFTVYSYSYIRDTTWYISRLEPTNQKWSIRLCLLSQVNLSTMWSQSDLQTFIQ